MKKLIAILMIAAVAGCNWFDKKDDKPDLPKPPASAGQDANKFLWKPKGEHSGKLVVLVPYSLSRDPVGTLTVNGIAGGYSQNKDNGQRAHYRFPKPGSAYGSNIKVELKRGKHKWSWTVPNGSQRYEETF